MSLLLSDPEYVGLKKMIDSLAEKLPDDPKTQELHRVLTTLFGELDKRAAAPAKLERDKPLGDRQAFPHIFEGMTYRQWLIGQALMGLLANPSECNVKTNADVALDSADAVIAALDMEALDIAREKETPDAPPA